MADRLQWEQASRILPPQHQQPQLHTPQQQLNGRNVLSRTPSSSAKAPRSKPAASLDLQSFTFIDHDDDLASKRIKDAKARKAIRSHVMRDVRRRERLAGTKRTPKRDDRKVKSSAAVGTSHSSKSPNKHRGKDVSDDADAKDNNILLRGTSSASPPTSELSLMSRSPTTSTSTTKDSSYSPSYPSPRCQSSTWMFDPFGTLPGSNSDTSKLLDGLFKYFIHVLIPMTFPAEQRHPEDTRNKQALISSATISDPGSFYGYMGLCAAHRAIIQGKHSTLSAPLGKKTRVLHEPDYYIMKSLCITEMNKKMDSPKLALTDSAFDIVISLTSCALTIGDFDEAQIHIKGLKKMVEMRGGVSGPAFQGESARVLNNILTCDVLAAAGMMGKPVFPLTWDPQIIPPETRKRILPPPTSPLFNTAIQLCSNPILSEPLNKALGGLREVLFFEHASNCDSTSFTGLEHQIFNFRNHEIEHELLDYPYRMPQTEPNTKARDLNLHPLESVARIAAICHMCCSFVVSPPSSGLTQSVVKHLIEALERFKPEMLRTLQPSWLDLLAWAMFLGARNSLDQPTMPWFLQRLGEVAAVRGWREWLDVELVLQGYMYIPQLHGMKFRQIWEQATSGPVVMELAW
ncbi:hypothetical protein AJ79_08194 [Helicocarpus griseus UAMH5409]|uniref:Tachykinin family protein n=1 Tax=Helicocarpus griseus UAMH5409 TaxID=1447875 RepID=A0A2B7WV88_9EURO|nr:hypothetical protein AJ79_08194 [Helicocarpus griseus UAMH5409]